MVTMHRETYQQAHAQGDLPAGPSRERSTKKKEKNKKQKWGKEDYKGVMYAFYMSLEKPAGSHTENTLQYGEDIVMMLG